MSSGTLLGGGGPSGPERIGGAAPDSTQLPAQQARAQPAVPPVAERVVRGTRAREVPQPYDGHGEPEARFLSVEDVLALHQDLIARFGGDPGVLNVGALEAAVAQPRMTAFGVLIHPTREAQAAAYLFHLTANHPFCDGNKRIGLFAALVFLRDNGMEVLGTSDDWYTLTMGVATSTLTKRELTRQLAAFVRRA